MDHGNDEPADGSKSVSSQVNYLSHIFLLAIPLAAAPVAFYVNSTQSSSHSLGLEFLLIGVLVIEFGALVIMKSDIFNSKGVFRGDSSERFEVRLKCSKCSEYFRYSLTTMPKQVVCPNCSFSSKIRVNDDYDGIVHMETPSP